MEVVLALASVGVLLVAVSPLAAGVWALVLFLRVQSHRAVAARLQGTVVEFSGVCVVRSGGHGEAQDEQPDHHQPERPVEHQSVGSNFRSCP